MTTPKKPLRLTSLLRVEERLLEAEYFVRRLAKQRDSQRFGYELNAFLSAARTVTFLLQKELSAINGFSSWWEDVRTRLRDDESARFFLELRNFSQKQGPVSLVSAWIAGRGRPARWTFMFAGTAKPVPASLLNRDVAECCREHLGKLGRVVLDCTDAFPYHCCPQRTLTPEGVHSLQIDLDAVDASLGYPPGWTNIACAGVVHDRIECLRRHVDGLDFKALRRIARLKARPSSAPEAGDFGDAMGISLVEQIEARRISDGPNQILMNVLAERLTRRESNDES